MSLRINRSLYFFIVERIKHNLQLIYVPELVSTEIKLKDAKQCTLKEPLFTNQTTMKNFKCESTLMKNLSELDIKLNKGKVKIETADVKKSKVVEIETPDKENEVKILKVRKGDTIFFFNLKFENCSTWEMPLHSPPQSLCQFTLNTILINISGSLTLYYYIHVHTIAVLYQSYLYNISHLLSVVSSGGIFFKPLTHDLIIQTVKMISEREKLSIP